MTEHREIVGLFEVGDGGLRLVGTTREPEAIEMVAQWVRPVRPEGVNPASRAQSERRLQLVHGGADPPRTGVDGVGSVDSRGLSASTTHLRGDEP